jgi:ribosome maturation factor RimP
MSSSLERELEELLAGIGYELVSLERGGGRRRPLFRLRVDRPGGRPGHSSVTVEDCALVSREVQAFMEAQSGPGEDIILEVSSPGIERPLVRRQDYERFTGQKVRVRGFGLLPGGSRQVEGELAGLAGSEGSDERVVVRVGGERVEIPLAAISRMTLAYDVGNDL